MLFHPKTKNIDKSKYKKEEFITFYRQIAIDGFDEIKEFTGEIIMLGKNDEYLVRYYYKGEKLFVN